MAATALTAASAANWADAGSAAGADGGGVEVDMSAPQSPPIKAAIVELCAGAGAGAGALTFE